MKTHQETAVNKHKSTIKTTSFHIITEYPNTVRLWAEFLCLLFLFLLCFTPYILWDMDASETYDTAKSNNSPVRPAWPSFSVSSSCIISSISLPYNLWTSPASYRPKFPERWRNAFANVTGLAPTNSVNDTILPFAKPEFSYLQQHPMSFGPAVPRWKPSFYVYCFVLLFSLILSTLVRDREQQARYDFMTGRDRETEANPGRNLSLARFLYYFGPALLTSRVSVFFFCFLFFFDTLQI